MNIIKLILMILLLGGCKSKSDHQIPESEDSRIISLSPHWTEIIYELNLEDQLLAVSDFCNYPARAKEKEKIGGLFNPNIEKIVSLKPDLILGVPSHSRLNQQLSEFGLQIVMHPNENISDILQSIELMGTKTSKVRESQELIRYISSRLDSIKMAASRENPKTAMLIIGREKGQVNDLTVAGKETFLSEIWTLAGGENAFEDLPTRYASVNLESILDKNPDIIIEFETIPETGVVRTKPASEWMILRSVNAIKNENIFTISAGYTMIPGPRLIRLAGDMLQIIKQAD